MILRSMLSLPRATTVGLDRIQGRDMVNIVVRATNKTGAIATARLEAMKTIPLREQQVERVRQRDTDRLFNKWEVEVSDKESMAEFGK